VEFWRYSPYNLEGSMSIWVLHTILCAVSILVMFDWRSYFEVRPNLSSVRIKGLGNLIPPGYLVHDCTFCGFQMLGHFSAQVMIHLPFWFPP
jgi:hypothetical protein